LEIVCLHGAGESAAVWQHQVDALPSVRALDLPGHGSTPGPGHKTLDGYADWTAARLAGSPPLLLAGHSMGGAIVMHLALRDRRPPWLVGLILVSTGAVLGVGPKFYFLVEHNFEGMVDLVTGLPGGTERQKAARQLLRRDVERAGPEVIRDDYLTVDNFDISDQVGRIDLPTLVAVGGDDKVTPPAKSEFLSSHIPGASLVVIPGAGHVPMLEAPAEMALAMRGFRAKVERLYKLTPADGIERESDVAGRRAPAISEERTTGEG
jgi:pimeloyl-ACP methyl ester carboxylesterase